VLEARNSKHEIRNTEAEEMNMSQAHEKSLWRCLGLFFLRFGICFGFRISLFGFPLLLIYTACLAFCGPVGAQGPAPQKQPLVFPIVVAPPDNPQAPSLDCVVSFGPPVPVSALAFSPDGKTLAAGGYQEVLLWDLAGAKLAKRIGVGQIGDFVRSVAFRPGAPWLAVAEGTAYGPGAVKIFDVGSGQPVLAFQEPKDAVFAVAFSPDGKLLAAGGADNVARVWSVDENKLVTELKGHTGWVLGVSFSADGKFLATSSDDRTAQVWEVGTWKLVAKLDQMEPVSGASFGPNAELVAVAVGGPTDRMIRLRRRDNAQLARAIDMGVPAPLGVLWAPAGNRMYVPLTDKTVRVYDPNSGGHVATLAGHTDWVYGVALTPDGATLASAGADGTVKLWHTGENRLLATLVQVTPRTDEWLVVAPPGYVAASSLGAVEWRAAHLTTPPDQIPAVVHNPELVQKAIAGEKLPAPAIN
jgi:WD40 repeat protein